MKEIFTIILAALPFVGIGFYAGLCFAKSTYLPTIRWQRKQIHRFQRNALQATEPR